MKKVFVIMVVALLFSACGNRTSKDVNVEDINSACECVGAMIIVGNDILDYTSDMLEDELMDDEGLKVKLDKMDEINKVCEEYSEEEAMACDNWEEFEETMTKIMNKF